jgi:hypothetical protein
VKRRLQEKWDQEKKRKTKCKISQRKGMAQPKAGTSPSKAKTEALPGWVYKAVTGTKKFACNGAPVAEAT